MCGIALALDLKRRGRAARWALPYLRHRGPDSEAAYAEPAGNAVLEHCRLAIIDPENREADQPFWDPSGRWAIVYNGEIFNFRELRAELERAGVRFRTNSDTEVVLLGYLARGPDILRGLRGMFAFVVWDRETGDAFGARDQIGVKPLYYTVSDGLLVAASEMRALLAYPTLRPRLDPASLVEFLAFGHTYQDRTIVEDVRKLPAGHYLEARGETVTVTEYWDVIPPVGPPPEQPEEELRELLDESVAAALVSDVPVALMLSGGLDSSTIAALAVRHADPGGLTAYSVAFGRADDEASTAERLASDLGIRHRTIRVTEDELAGEFDAWVADLDYPSANPTAIASSFIARAAREDGIKVLLSGDGGDELFGGYNRWMRYLRFHDRVWRRVPKAARTVAGRSLARWTPGLAGDIARRAANGGELFVPSRPFHDDVLLAALGSVGREAAEAAPPEAPIERLRRQFDERMPGGDYLAWMSYVFVKTKLVEDFLERLDTMGMRHSVEGRVPLLDPRLAEWAFRVPQAVKTRDFEQKALFRAAVTPLLPQYILERPKQGFCPPVADWAEQLLARRSWDGAALADAGLVRADALARLHAGGARDSFAAWTLALLTAWVGRHLGARAQPLAATPA